jgi:AhpD family alkylhydroperoxidase
VTDDGFGSQAQCAERLRRRTGETAVAESQPEPMTLFSPAVRELVALGAALAGNCEPCLRHHYREAKKLGISDDDIRSAFDMAAMVKQTPARHAQALAEKLLGSMSTNRARQEE